MIKVGLVGEDPNDTTAITHLLSSHYKGSIKFKTLARRIKGYQLDNDKIKKIINLEFKDQKCEFVIYIRDLDSYGTDKKKIKERIDWFISLDKEANGKGLLLLNIWELEGLIFADIETFCNLYKVSSTFKGDCTLIKEPKEQLMRLTKRAKNPYKESHCPTIFEKLRIDTLKANCNYFREFVSQIDQRL